MNKPEEKAIDKLMCKTSNVLLSVIVLMFESSSEEVFTKSDVIDRIKTYQKVMNEEFKINDNG